MKMTTLEKIDAVKTARLLIATIKTNKTNNIIEALLEIERDLWIEEVGNVLNRKRERKTKK